MKKEFIFVTLLLLFAVTPVIAYAHENGNHGHTTLSPKDSDDKKNHFAAVSITGTPCNPVDFWKNHGVFVSCMAHLHHYGDNDVDDAARSDIGKYHPTETPTPVASVTLIPSETITPTTSPEPTISQAISPEPTTSTEPTASATPDISDMDTYHQPAPNDNIQNIFGNIFDFIVHLL